jgi:DNA-binding response OmpR family regulator
MRILLVEDEISIRDVVKLNLELEGYEVVTSGNGRQALEMIYGQHFDLLLLDVMLPEVDGFTIAEQVRLSNTEVPILMLTAKDQAQDKIMGLKKGADDYLVKPFNLEELLLRVGILTRRSQRVRGESADLYEFGDNKINFENFEAHTWRGETRKPCYSNSSSNGKTRSLAATKSFRLFGATMCFQVRARLTTSFWHSVSTLSKTPKRRSFFILCGV